jgi:hypothetical protein
MTQTVKDIQNYLSYFASKNLPLVCFTKDALAILQQHGKTKTDENLLYCTGMTM